MAPDSVSTLWSAVAPGLGNHLWQSTLKWAPDESQFGGHAPSSPSDDPNAPPNLFTAIQQQIGLKLDAVKTPVDVLVLDRVEKPSAN
jgi:uncharacterized protein (TIGR03435 family)